VRLDPVTVVDSLCTGFTCGSSDLAPVSNVNGVITWTFALAPGASQVIHLTATAVGTCPTVLNCTNIAHVDALCFQARASARATVNVQVTCPVPNCPRTVGFWSQQCLQKENGSTKYSRTQVTAIAHCVDVTSSFFSFGDAFANFCAIINPPRPMTLQNQTYRQYAGLLANICASDIPTSNGEHVRLDPNTPINFPGLPCQTIACLITEADSLLAYAASHPSAAHDIYALLEPIFDAINNGKGIGTTCGVDAGQTFGTEGDEALGGFAQLSPAVPNPFSGTTSFALTVPNGSTGRTSVVIYNVAGRAIRTLVDETREPGVYSLTWDGRDQSGVQMAHGVYFLRAVVGGRQLGQRLLYLGR